MAIIEGLPIVGHKTETKLTAQALAQPSGKLVSQEIEDVRSWLRKTYGGHWGSLQMAAQDVREMEKKLLRNEREIERLEGNLARATR